MAPQKSKGKKKAKKSGGAGSSAPPMALGYRERNRSASVRSGNRSVVIRHREYLVNVTGTEEFQWDVHVVNPGLSKSFPWLSAIACRFETYRFRRLAFEYVPRCAATTPGAVTLLFDYDVSDDGPATLSEAMAYAHTVRGSAWQSLRFESLQSDRESGGARKFVRATSEFEFSDRLSDQGSLFICVDGCPTQALGEMWVEYEVEFFTPQLEPMSTEGTGVIKFTPVGTMEGGALRGLTKSRMECTTDYGIDCKIDDGVLTFMSPFQGHMSHTVVPNGASGAMSLQGGYDPAVPGAKGLAPEVLANAIGVLAAAGAGQAGYHLTAMQAPTGSKVRLKTTNAVGAASDSLLNFARLSDEDYSRFYGNASKLRLTGLA